MPALTNRQLALKLAVENTYTGDLIKKDGTLKKKLQGVFALADEYAVFLGEDTTSEPEPRYPSADSGSEPSQKDPGYSITATPGTTFTVPSQAYLNTMKASENAQRSFDDGWNKALDYARDEIVEHFDELVSTMSKGGKSAVLDAIDARVTELKK